MKKKTQAIITPLALFLWTYGCSYCAPHDVGIAKLAIYGFDEKKYCYIYSYLKSKQQCANLNNIKSTLEEAISGDLQGSIIGPFDIFFNYFFYFTLVTSSLNFADGNIPQSFAKVMENITSILETESEIAISWFKDNHLIMYPSKSQAIIVGKYKGNHINQIINIDQKKSKAISKKLKLMTH